MITKNLVNIFVRGDIHIINERVESNIETSRKECEAAALCELPVQETESCTVLVLCPAAV